MNYSFDLTSNHVISLWIITVFVVTLVFLVRHKAYVVVKVFGLFQITLQDIPPSELKQQPEQKQKLGGRKKKPPQ